MRGFWKQRSEFEQLERELRRERSRPSSEYLQTLATRLQSERVTPSRPSGLRFRVGLAAAMTGALGVAAAASGGLQYANTASTHSVKAVAHVFSSTTSDATHGQRNRDAAQSRAADDAAAATESAPAAAASVSAEGESAPQSDAGRSVVEATGDRFRSDAAARRQYVEFVYVCLGVPRRHPFIFITLRLPRVAADFLVARGLARPGPC